MCLDFTVYTSKFNCCDRDCSGYPFVFFFKKEKIVAESPAIALKNKTPKLTSGVRF